MRSFADGITITPVKLSTTSFRVEHSQSLRMLNFDLYPKQAVAFYSTATEISHRALASGILVIQMRTAGALTTERAASDSFPPLRKSGRFRPGRRKTNLTLFDRV
jgi:hypothetical protein